MLNNLTIDRLKEFYTYNPETGLFYHLKARQKVIIGSIAGFTLKTNAKYVYLTVDGQRYLAHRLAFLYMTGSWPKNLIDHKDNNGLNNKWENLREANRSQNGLNSRVKSTNRLGVKGISKNNKGYLVRVCLGTYDTIEEAIEVYNKAILQFFGEFANLSKLPELKLNA